MLVHYFRTCVHTTCTSMFEQHVQWPNQWNMHSNTVQVVVVQVPLCTLYSYVLQPTTVNSTFTTHVLQCHIYFVIIPLLIPHTPGLYGLRNGSLALLKYCTVLNMNKIKRLLISIISNSTSNQREKEIVKLIIRS